MTLIFKIIIYSLLIPFLISMYILYFGLYFFIKIFEYSYYFILWLFRLIIGIFTGNKKRTIYYKSSNNNYNTNNSNKKIIDLTKEDYDEKFEEESKLWGLSKEDKRLAKEERMSPADFVEAEERDDDELVTDEWEEE